MVLSRYILLLFETSVFDTELGEHSEVDDYWRTSIWPDSLLALDSISAGLISHDTIGGRLHVDVALARKDGKIVPTWIGMYGSGKLGGEGSPFTGANIKVGGKITYLLWHPKLGVSKFRK